MNKKVIALAATVTLFSSLTACGLADRIPDVHVTPDGEVVTDNVTDPAPEYSARTAYRDADGNLIHNGRYVAYPDGAIAKNRSSLGDDVKNAAENAKDGIARAERNTGSALERTGKRMIDASYDM